MATITQKSKTVQNYILESIKYVNPDQSEIWVAKHKILKKSYMLKRIKYVKSSRQNIENGVADDQTNAINFQKILREIQLLKQFKIEGSPKCQKMIKTTNNIYVVYDQFLGTSIYQIFRTHRNAHEQKLSIMIKLAKLLLNFHQQQIVFLQLSPHNIFLQNNQNLFISQWSLTIYKGNNKNIFPVNNTNGSEYFANQVLQESIYSKASDIFSLGKIFSFIYSNTTKSNQFESAKEINSLIEKMTDAYGKKRPTLEEVIETMENIQKNYGKSLRLCKSKKMVRKNVQSPCQQLRNTVKQTQISQEKSIYASSPSILKQKSCLDQNKDIQSSRAIASISFDNILTGMSRTTSKPGASRFKKTSDSLIRKINKDRNLSFFLMDLSEFALRWPQGEQSGYLLLKQSYLILNNCYNEWNNQDFQDKKCQKMTNILKDEIVQLNLSLNMLKEFFLPQKISQQLKVELRSDLSINDRYYKQKMIAFCSNLMKQLNTMIKQNKIKSLSSLVDDLFSIYMILKRLEQGSYEKYWDKIYNQENAFLKNQKYFNEEKKLGYRYLKSKITQILSKK